MLNVVCKLQAHLDELFSILFVFYVFSCWESTKAVLQFYLSVFIRLYAVVARLFQRFLIYFKILDVPFFEFINFVTN